MREYPIQYMHTTQHGSLSLLHVCVHYGFMTDDSRIFMILVALNSCSPPRSTGIAVSASSPGTYRVVNVGHGIGGVNLIVSDVLDALPELCGDKRPEESEHALDPPRRVN